MGARTIAPLCVLLVFITGSMPCDAQGPPQALPAFTIESAEYAAALREKKLDVSGDFVVEVFGDGRVFVPLLPAGTAVADLKIQQGDAHPCRSAEGVGFLAEKKGKYRVGLRFVLDADLRGKTGRGVFPLTAAGRCWIDLTLPPGQKIETKPEAPLEGAGAGKTRIFPQPGGKIELEWYPQEYAKEVEPLIRAREASQIRVDAGLITRQVQIVLDVARGRVDALRIQFPETADLRALRAEGVREWRVEKATGCKEVVVAFQDPLRGEARLDLTLQQPFDLGAPLTLRPVAVAGAAQQQGRMVLDPCEGVTIREAGASGARKSDAAQAIDHALLQYEYDALPAEIRIIAEAARPKIAASVQTLAVLERGIISLSSVVAYNIRGAQVRSFKMKFPRELSIIGVTGDGPIETRFLQETGFLVVTVLLRTRAEGKYTLKIEAQQNLAKMNGIPIPRLETMDTDSETGMIGVAVGPDVNLIPFSAAKARQVDTAQLPAWMRGRGAKLGYAYTEKGGAVAVSTIKIEPRVTAQVSDTAVVGPTSVSRHVKVKCFVEERPIFAFKVQVPNGVAIISVEGDDVRDWAVNEAAGLLTVNLKSEVTGQTGFEVRGETRFAAPTATVKLGGFDLQGADKVEGRLGIAGEGDVDLKASSTTGLTAVPVEELPSETYSSLNALLGYRFGRVGWTLALEVRLVAPQLDVTLLSVLRFRPGLVTAVAEAQCNVRKAGMNAFEIELPKGASNSSVEADGLRTSELKNGVWRIELMGKVKGEYVFRVNYDIPLRGLSVAFGYTGAQVRGAANQSGFDVVCQEKSDAEIGVGDVAGATAVDESQLPREFADRLTLPIVRTYRWSAPERRIDFKVTGHLAGKTLQATVSQCEIKTLLKRDGEAINYLTCKLANTNKQFVKLDLGAAACVWAAYVDEQPVKACVAPDGKTLVPILGRGRGGVMDLAVIWSGPSPAMGLTGRLALCAPSMDVPVQAVAWKVLLPREYQVLSAKGNMEMMGGGARLAGLPTLLAEKFAWVGSVAYAVLMTIAAPLIILTVIVGVILAIMLLRKVSQYIVPLLVLLGVVVCLATMMLPSLSRARLRARGAYPPAIHARFISPVPSSQSPAEEAPVAQALLQSKGETGRPSARSDEIGVKQRAAQEMLLRVEKETEALETKEKLAEPAMEQRAKDESFLLRKARKGGPELRYDAAEERDALGRRVAATAPEPTAAPAPPGVPAPPVPGSELKTTEATGAGAGAGEGWRADRKGQAFGRAPAKPVTGPQPVALTTATATPIAMVDKLAHMQAGGAVTQLVSNLVGGRAKGAMPIEITFPTAGTATYEFRMPFAGATQGQIKLTCISTGAALCLQGLIGLVVLCVALVLGWRRADWGALACAAGVILLILARGVSGPAGAEYLRTAYWAAGLALLVLVAKYLVGKVRLRNQLRNQVS